MSREVAGVGRCAWLAGRLAASICGEVSLDQSGACEVAIRYMSLRPAPWKKCCSGPPKPPCPWLNCPREEPPPPSARIRSVLLDLWLAAGGVARWRWGTEGSPAETLLLLRAEATDSQLGGGTVPCRAVPCRANPLSESVPVAVYAAVLLTTALIHQSQLRKLAAGDPGLHFIPLLSPPPPSFVIHQPTKAERNGVAIVNIPGGLSAWCAPPLVRLRHAELPVSPVTSLR